MRSNRAVVTSSNWMRLVVRENVRVCGYSEADQVPLVTFLEAIAARSADKNRAFDRLPIRLLIDPGLQRCPERVPSKTRPDRHETEWLNGWLPPHRTA